MLIIIGTGHAGYTVAREWRRHDAGSPLMLLTLDDGASYYKPDISKAFASGKDADGLVKATAAQMAGQLKADIRTGVEVTRIDPATRRVFAGDEAWTYSKLVLAAGAAPVRIPVAGDAADRILSVNNRLDYARLRAALNPGSRVLILGAGLIGCEFANDLAAAGFRVDVADIAGHPLPRLLPEPCGRALQAGLSALGVTWHLATRLERAESAPGGIRATLSDRTTVEANVVLSAVGLRPNVALAHAAGLDCAAGVVVDRFMKTSADDIYALGDCTEIAGRPMPFILPIAHGARALGPTLAGQPTAATFPAMPVTVKTPASPVIVCPPAAWDGRWEVTGDAPDLEALYRDAEGRPAGFALTGSAVSKRGALAAQIPAVSG